MERAARVAVDATAPVYRSLRSPTALGRAARWALAAEARLSPKPALVDARGSGAHTDLTLRLMLASAHTLEPHFCRIAELAWESPGTLPLRLQLGLEGRLAESNMLQTTGGSNTHRGAIWTVGLLVAAAAQKRGAVPLSSDVKRLACLPDGAGPEGRISHGAAVVQRYGVRGAKAEAESGMPCLFQVALPQLWRSRAEGTSERCARLNALLALMCRLEDTCILHRSGLTGLRVAQEGARQVLASGGAESTKGRAALLRLDHDLVCLGASPGGSADLLAGCLFIDALHRAPMWGQAGEHTEDAWRN